MTTREYSLFQFNCRVLDQGFVDKTKTYTYDELKQLLFFNKVFSSNMREMFEKGITLTDDDYILINKSYRRFNTNISMMLAKFNEISKDTAIVSDTTIDMQIQIEKVIHDQITLVTSKFDGSIMNFITQSGLYFIADNNLFFIDSHHSIFSKPIAISYHGKIIYTTTLIAITDWLKNRYSNVSSVYVSGSITEGSIDTNIINNFIYVDDIDQILSMYCNPTRETQSFNHINLDYVLDHDMLIEYPLDTFNEFLQFLSASINSNHVATDIYITLYRIGSDLALYNILKAAIMKGINVHVNVELKASGENINQFWFNQLKQIGVNVHAYKCGELKVHAKLALIRFKTGRMICHVGTGNYHTKTTAQYTDISLVTANKNICYEVKKLFDIMIGNESLLYMHSDNLLVTQYNCRDELNKLINQETDKGKDGLILIKCNSLDDPKIIKSLIKASEKGCKVILIVRGICTITPNKNIIVKSIIWDKLEHSRVFAFGKKNPIVYLGSLDLVTNKLDKRIEAMVKILEPSISMKLVNYLNRYITTKEGSWYKGSDGEYRKVK